MVLTLSPTTDLYLFPAELRVALPRVKPQGGFMAIPRRALPTFTPRPADRSAGAAESAPAGPPNPLVSQILAATSQDVWFQDVKDLSGGRNPGTPLSRRIPRASSHSTSTKTASWTWHSHIGVNPA